MIFILFVSKNVRFFKFICICNYSCSIEFWFVFDEELIYIWFICMFYLCSFYLKISFGNFVGDNNIMIVIKKVKGRYRKCLFILFNLGICIFYFIL